MNYTCDYSVTHREMNHRLRPQVFRSFNVIQNKKFSIGLNGLLLPVHPKLVSLKLPLLY